MVNIAYTFRHKPEVGRLTPNKQEERDIEELTADGRVVAGEDDRRALTEE